MVKKRFQYSEEVDKFAWLAEESDEEEYPINIKCSFNVLPRGVESSLAEEYTCVGSLQSVHSKTYLPTKQLSHVGFLKWTTQTWALRGHFLFYYKEDADVSSSKPVGGINLHRVDNVSLRSNNIYISYGGSSELQLKNVSINSDDPSTQVWFNLIDKHVNYSKAGSLKSSSMEAMVPLENHGVELSVLSSSGSRQNDDSSQSLVNNKAEKKNVLNNISNDDNVMPPTYLWVLRASGVVRYPGETYCWTWFIRFVFCISNVIFIAIFLNRLIRSATSVGCVKSLRPLNDKPPCLKFIAKKMPTIFASLNGLLVYCWLMINMASISKSGKLLATHTRRMFFKLEKFAVYCRGYVFVTGCFSALFACFKIHLNSSWMVFTALLYFIFFLTFCWFFFIAIVPYALLSLLYYSESRRLRLMVKDFIKLMKAEKDFHYDQIAFAYLELVDEFESVNDQYGTLLSIFEVLSLFVIVMDSVVILYGDNDGLHVISILNALVLMMTILLSLISTNSRSELILKEASKLSPQAVSSFSSVSSSSSHLYDTNNKHGGVHQNHHKQVLNVDMLKLMTLFERAPCELRLLGRKFSVSDIYSVVAFLLFVQFLNFIGLNNALG